MSIELRWIYSTYKLGDMTQAEYEQEMRDYNAMCPVEQAEVHNYD